MTTNQSTRASGSKASAPRAKRRTRSSSPEPTQLRLLDGGRTSRKAWQLDARTRRIGRQRVAEAQEILRRAQPTAPVPHDKIAG
jgi:hypothetical protein